MSNKKYSKSKSIISLVLLVVLLGGCLIVLIPTIKNIRDEIQDWIQDADNDNAGGNENDNQTGKGDQKVIYTEKIAFGGFSLLQHSDTQKYGIRFTSTVDKDFYDNLCKRYGAENVHAYTVIFPASYVTTGVTLEDLDATASLYLKIEAQNSWREDDNRYSFTGVLDNILEKNYNRRFVGYGMVEITDGAIRYYSSDVDFYNTCSYRSVSLRMDEDEDGVQHFGLRFCTSFVRYYYNNLISVYGKENIAFKTAICPMSYVYEAGAPTIEKLDESSKKYILTSATEALEEDEISYTFAGSLSEMASSSYGLAFCSIGFLEITDDTGAVVRRIYR